jgi:hypothetical protein
MPPLRPRFSYAVVVLRSGRVYGKEESIFLLAARAPAKIERNPTMLDEEDQKPTPTFSAQVLSFLLHTLLAVSSWLVLMLAGYIFDPVGFPQILIFALSLLFPLAVGATICRFRPDSAAPLVWFVGLIWLLIISLWVLDMPTGPNQCFQCDATEKLTRTFFPDLFLSGPKPSGLIDNDGPFIGTWPAAALIGYAIGARITLRRRAAEK